MGTEEHKEQGPPIVDMGILTMSSTRTRAEDRSGEWIAKAARDLGHRVIYHEVIPDEAEAIAGTVLQVIEEKRPHVLLLNGGTGISPKDVTVEALAPLFEKELSAFGPLFSQLSYEEIGSAALMSRSTAGIIGSTAIFCMPGSQKACRLACEKLIFPELGHIVKHMKEK